MEGGHLLGMVKLIALLGKTPVATILLGTETVETSDGHGDSVEGD